MALDSGYLGQADFGMKPIIEAYITEMNAKMEEDCVKVCQSYGFDVDKERLKQALTDARKFYDEGKRDAVKHGRWVSDKADVLFHCSVCETQISTSWDYDCDEMWNYCPHCGARMDGDDHE